MAPFIQNAYHKKEHAGAQAVINHLQDCATHALLAATKNTQDNETHVSHGRVGDQALGVFLSQGDHRPIQNTNHSQGDEQRRPERNCIREKGESKADKTVSAHFQQDAGQNYRACGWRFHVSRRQPGVQREQGHFDGKGQGKSKEQPDLQAGRQLQRFHQGG